MHLDTLEEAFYFMSLISLAVYKVGLMIILLWDMNKVVFDQNPFLNS